MNLNRRKQTLLQMAGLISCAMGFAISASLKEKGHLYQQLNDEVWIWQQQSEGRHVITNSVRRQLLQKLRSSNEYKRWDAAAELASRGDTSAVPHLITEMLDDTGTQST